MEAPIPDHADKLRAFRAAVDAASAVVEKLIASGHGYGAIAQVSLGDNAPRVAIYAADIFAIGRVLGATGIDWRRADHGTSVEATLVLDGPVVVTANLYGTVVPADIRRDLGLTVVSPATTVRTPIPEPEAMAPAVPLLTGEAAS